ncbi:GPW/gp25 family protein [Xenorhabdus ishibashii]|uniref:Phage baseplate protein n=1 Tax=Xenorhabdus ishibashii TaxID=1034471 RepID=A0A2D0KA99_9GAMM|nr:GPW/gp25 family protein [Xenorhabdus ishibashii]PHM60366.1 phage baseplate protein [Xenorhabdus ishibashii]
MAKKILAELYGRGWAFPPQFFINEDQKISGVTLTEGEINVRQSMSILFLTEPGERIMREEYGCGLSDYLFANISDELMADIQTRIEECVLRYEPRANITDIQISQRTDFLNTLHIQVIYTLRGSDINQQLESILTINEGQLQVIL